MSHRLRPVVKGIRGIVLAAPVACLGLASEAHAQAATAAAAPASAASASSGDDNQVQTVTVTARKRVERGQDVPQSLNVFTGSALEATGVSTFDQLQYRIPGVAVVAGAGNEISIRGVSNNASQRGGGPSTAVQLDGVYLPRPEMALGEVFDLNRVEVLKGPEGTLYGRNATAGVVNYVTRDPGTGTGFDGFVGGGSYGLARAQVALNLGTGEMGGFRLSAATSHDNGYTHNDNPVGGRIDARDFQAARLKGSFQLTSAIETKLTVQLVDDKGTVGYGLSEAPGEDDYVSSLGAPQRADPRHINIDTRPRVRKHGVLVSAQVDDDLGSGLDLKSITGYVGYSSNVLFDSDGTGGFIENLQTGDRSNFLSQEFQLSGGSPTGLSWTSGLYFSKERTSGTSLVVDSNSYPDDLTPFTYSSQVFAARSHSEAIFGEATYALSKEWSIVGGARYTKEQMSGTSSGGVFDFGAGAFVPFDGGDSTSASKATPKVLLQYKPSTDSMIYASVTQGFKSGGINFYPPIKTYKPERITAYEIGQKSLLLGGALELEAAAFYYDYSDLQLRTVVGTQAPISNVSKATVKGFEFSGAARPTRDLTIDFNAAVVDTRLEDYLSPATGTDLSGMALPLSPKFSATVGAQYRFGFSDGSSLTPRVEVNHQSSLIFPALQDPSIERRGGITLLNADFKYAFNSNHNYVSLIGRNLTNRTYLSNRSYSAGFQDAETFAAPRTVEVRLGADF